MLARLKGAALVTCDVVDEAAAAGVKWFPKGGSTHRRLLEAVQTNQMREITQGFASSGSGAKRSRAQ